MKKSKQENTDFQDRFLRDEQRKNSQLFPIPWFLWIFPWRDILLVGLYKRAHIQSCVYVHIHKTRVCIDDPVGVGEEERVFPWGKIEKSLSHLNFFLLRLVLFFVYTYACTHQIAWPFYIITDISLRGEYHIQFKCCPRIDL